MKLYLVSAIAGGPYTHLQVRSPAPQLVALVGLCGIYRGELGTAALIQWIQSRT